jgi:hypothetical protein
MTVYGSGPGAPHDPHVDVGAYVLGVLDYDDMARFEQHLALCPECGRQLDELSGLVPVLAELAPPGAGVPAPPSGDAMLGKLITKVGADQRKRRSRRWFALAAAAALIITGPTVAVIATQGGGTSSAPQAVHSGSNTATGAKATVGTTKKGWGTQVGLSLSGIKGPLVCRLVAIGKDGSEQTVSTWSVPAAGYGTSAQPQPLELTGGSGMTPADIARFDVVTAQGSKLVSVSNT